MATTIPTRLIICVDGTWYNPDGGANKTGNITNIYRLYASVKTGECQDPSGRRYIQEKHYVHGIGSEDTISKYEKSKTGAFGLKCFDQIKNVYRECCRLAGPNDEVWLYGFSRGAYVVRAVAGLLHYMRAISSATRTRSGSNKAFEADYEEALKTYQKMVRNHSLREEDGSRITSRGTVHHFFSEKTRPAPRLQFLGVFDTVRKVKDQRQYEIGWNGTIQHLRAAVALNEDRYFRKPKMIWPPLAKDNYRFKDRSCIQAWFVGTHIDMGGSAERDGLALYPLQWIMLESEALGLVFGFEGTFDDKAPLENPLQLVGMEGNTKPRWQCKTENGVVVQMRDIRQLHEERRYALHLNNNARGMRFILWRKPFDGDSLGGYCNWAPQGTIIHPSVYLVMEASLSMALSKMKFPFDIQLGDWRERMLGQKADGNQNEGFWNDQNEKDQDLGPMRILVCGNAGVGKSTLINKVFGTVATTTEDHISGEHDIWKEIVYEDRPDLIVHDSEGFEAGREEEMIKVENFLKKKSKEQRVQKRLHAVWFCIDAINCRAMQASTQKMIDIMKRHGGGIAFIIVATKMDQFLTLKEKDRADEFREAGRPVDETVCKNHAQEELEKCITRLKEGIREHEGQYAKALATSKFDMESIMSLNAATLELIKSDTGRLRYVAAQVLDVDKKRRAALQSVMSLYRVFVKSAAMTAGIPGGPTANRSAAAIRVSQTVLRSFGITTVTWETVMSILKQNIPEDLPNMLGSTLMEGLTAVGVLGTILTGGMPLVLAPMAINALPMAHMNAQLFLLLAVDLILILSRAYQEAAMKCKGKPDANDVEEAALAYRQHFKAVHFEVKDIVPDGFGVFRSGRVKARLEDLIDKWVSIVVEGVGSPPAGDYRAERRGEEENRRIERSELNREDGEESEDHTDDGER